MPYRNKILNLRDRAAVRDRWLLHRLDQILPGLMIEEGIDLWIVTSQENNEDPVMKTLLPSPMMTSRRRTILLFSLKQDGSVDCLSISRPGSCLDKAYRSVWLNSKDSDWSQFTALSPDKGIAGQDQGPPETQMECLARVVGELDPARIGLNFSQSTAYGDGISHGSYTLISESLMRDHLDKLVSAEGLAVRWLESRTDQELAAYKGIISLTADIMREGLSRAVIHPGVTTAEDLEWWLMQRCSDLGLEPWFPFMVALRRWGATGLSGKEIIQEGDVIHCDIGFEYLGLCSDLQYNAYVLGKNETGPPPGILALFEQGKRFQDIVCGNFKAGRTGNQILAASLQEAASEGIRGMLYSHPIGNYGHSAGPTMGLVDNQKHVGGTGEFRVYENTAYALELNVAGPVPEWDGQLLMLGIETDIVFADGRVEYLDRQDQLCLVG